MHFNSNYSKYWTNDLDDMIRVMYYLFPKDFSNRKIKNMDEEEIWIYIDNYWLKKDPTPNTLENELLIQLNKRIKYVNNNFSILKMGWETDRGKIYIIYGPPERSESYTDELGNNYQKWIYQNGSQFIFVDRTMSNNYTLYRQFY